MVDELKAENEALQSELTEAMQAKSQWQERVANYDRELDGMKTKVSMLQTALQTRQMESDKLQELLEHQSNGDNALIMQVNFLKTRCEALQQEMQRKDELYAQVFIVQNMESHSLPLGIAKFGEGHEGTVRAKRSCPYWGPHGSFRKSEETKAPDQDARDSKLLLSCRYREERQESAAKV